MIVPIKKSSEACQEREINAPFDNPVNLSKQRFATFCRIHLRYPAIRDQNIPLNNLVLILKTLLISYIR